MGIIRTVTGDIAPDELGVCYMHEHLMGAPPEPYASQDPDLVLDDEAGAIASLNGFLQAGGRALVEMTPIDYHRNPAALKQISERTDVWVIAVTGYLKEKFCKALVEPQTVDELAERFVREIERGMDDTDIRAGVIKVASSLNVMTENERKVFIAAAQAQQATGALISTHTEAGTMALEQIQLLIENGVSPERILIGHLDRCLDINYHMKIAQTGVYMGFDQISKMKYASEDERIRMIQRLIASGHKRQIMLSMDIARKSYLPVYGGNPGFQYLIDNFVPMMKAAGISQETIDVMLVENSARALTIERRQ